MTLMKHKNNMIRRGGVCAISAIATGTVIAFMTRDIVYFVAPQIVDYITVEAIESLGSKSL